MGYAFIQRMQYSSSVKFLERYGSIILILLVWTIISCLGIVSEDVIPTIFQVIKYLIISIISGDIFPHIFASLARALTGFLASVIIGVPLGILMARVRILDRLTSPLMAVTYPIPKVALLPLFILWLGIGFLSKFSLVLIGCIYPIVFNTYQGVKMVDKIWIWSGLSMGASRWGLLVRIIFPATLPYIFVGARISLAISFLILFGVEMVGTRNGLGALIINAMEEHRPDIIFAAAFCIGVLGYTFNKLLLVIRSRVLDWRKEEVFGG